MPTAPAAVAPPPALSLLLGARAHPLPLPLLAGSGTESLFPEARPLAGHGAFELSRSGDWLLGYVSMPIGRDLELATARVYSDLLAATPDHALCRIWNYVPQINAPGSHGLENYRSFCRARSLAFETAFGRDFKPRLPAGSAVGTDSDALVVIFAAHRSEPQHFENPRQVSAYDYPLEHGPRPPSFARATVVDARAARTTFISGTAAIVGHRTVAVGDTVAQLGCTLENLRAIGTACGLGESLGAPRARRHSKVYLRRDSDYAAVAALLDREFWRPGDEVSYVRADICRAPLEVEIELTVIES